VSNSNTGVVQNVTINEETQSLEMSYAPQSSGQAILVVRATDSGGAFVDTTVKINVSNSKAIEVPNIPSPSQPDGTEVEIIELTPEAEEPEADTTEESEEQSPSQEDVKPEDDQSVELDSGITDPILGDFLSFTNNLNTAPSSVETANLLKDAVAKQQAKQKNQELKQDNFSISASPSTPLIALINPQTSELDDEDINLFNREIKRVKDEISQTVQAEQQQQAIVASMTISLTTGIVVWGLRAGSFIFTLFSLTPLWRGFDPLPFVSGNALQKTIAAQRKDKDEEDKEEGEVGHMFDTSLKEGEALNTKN